MDVKAVRFERLAALFQWFKRRRPPPLVLLLLVMGVLAGSIALEESTTIRRSSLLNARTSYVTAVTDTRSQLSALLAHVATDKTLAQNLNWRLSHSVQSALQARLQKGSLDQVVLMDEGCREVAQVRVDGSATIPCPFTSGDQEAKADTFYWLQGSPFPILVLARQVAGVNGADVYAVGSVTLDEDWLALSPDLKHWTTKLDLTIGLPTESTHVIVAEGLNSKGEVYAALLSRDSWDEFLLDGDGGPFGIGPAMVGPCLVLAFGLAGWALYGDRRRRRRDEERHQTLVEWCRNLTPGGSVQIPGRIRNDQAPDALERLITHAMLHKNDELRLVARRLAAAENDLQSRDIDIKRLKHRLAELAELDSMAVQLARTTQSFLERMQQFRDDAQDLTDLTNDGLAPRARLLQESLGMWQDGVRDRGARKFLRGLAETPTNAQGDVTRLDEDLNLFKTLASEIDDQALAASMRTRALLESAAFAAKLAGLWRGIALKTHEDKNAPTLVGPMDEAQSLIRLEVPTMEFRNGIDPRDAQDIPPLPRTVWVTALYHVYLAMAELTRGTGAIIVTRMRHEDGKSMLVVQVAAKDQKALPRRGETEAYHLDVSRSILSPFPVTLTVLPSLDGPFPIAMTWAVNAVQTERPPTLAGSTADALA